MNRYILTSLFIVILLLLTVLPVHLLLPGYLTVDLLNLLHFPAVLLLYLLLSKVFFQGKNSTYLFSGIFLTVILVEYIQLLISRSFDMHDMYFGWLGLLAASCMTHSKFKTLGLSVSVAYGINVLYQLFIMAQTVWQYPMIANFDTPGIGAYCRNVNDLQDHLPLKLKDSSLNSMVTEVTNQNSKWSGLSCNLIVPMNIQNSTKIAFNIFSLDESKSIDIKISDTQNKSLIISKKIIKNRWIKIMHSLKPSSQGRINLNNIIQVSIYYDSEVHKSGFRIDDIEFL